MVVHNASASPALPADLFSMAAMTEMSVHAMAMNPLALPANANQEARTPQHCKYPSKKCWNLRVEKRNGEMHKFCEYHRQKANSNQRRMEQRRKQMRMVHGVGEELFINTNVINHAKHIMAASPNGIDQMMDGDFPPFALTHEPMSMDVPFTPSDMNMIEFDVGLDAAIDCMMIDHDIDMEPSDLPVDLYEADLFFLEHFMTEINHSAV